MPNNKILEEIYKTYMYKEILLNQDEYKIWQKLENGCYIGTLGYSEKILMFYYFY